MKEIRIFLHLVRGAGNPVSYPSGKEAVEMFITPVGVAFFIVNVGYLILNIPLDPEMDDKTRVSILYKESIKILVIAIIEDLITMIFK